MATLLSPPAGRISDEDRRFLETVAARPNAEPLSALTSDVLRDITALDGIDVATAILYQAIRRAPAHQRFIEAVESEEAIARPDEIPRVVLMPGAFYKDYANTGADGSRVFDLADQLSWPVARVPVPSLSSMAGNAAILAEFLALQSRRPTILVSLSKGGADVRAALALSDARTAFRDVICWVNLSGIVKGTPLVAWLRARPMRCMSIRLLLRFRRQRFASIDELRHGAGTPLSAPFSLPPGMRAIHVVGCPRVRHLSNDWARRAHARLAPLGPNDGGGILLSDVTDLAGQVYPVWGADHYLQPAWDVQPLLLNILRAAAAGNSTE